MIETLESRLEKYPNLTKECNKEHVVKSGLLTDSNGYTEKLECTYLGKCKYQERNIFISNLPIKTCNFYPVEN